MTQPMDLSHAVLLCIDLQDAIDHPSWGVRNNLDAEDIIATLQTAWRAQGRPVWHVRHDSTDPESHYRPGQPGHNFKPDTAPVGDEPVIPKTVHSAFIGTDLVQRLSDIGCTQLVIVGVITNNSVEATVRNAGNLGYDTYLVADGCFTFGRSDWRGVAQDAETVHALSLANMDGEYCTVLTAQEVLASI